VIVLALVFPYGLVVAIPLVVLPNIAIVVMCRRVVSRTRSAVSSRASDPNRRPDAVESPTLDSE
jgi:hypothetical protein